jgi:hypothetical protein
VQEVRTSVGALENEAQIAVRNVENNARGAVQTLERRIGMAEEQARDAAATHRDDLTQVRNDLQRQIDQQQLEIGQQGMQIKEQAARLLELQECIRQPSGNAQQFPGAPPSASASSSNNVALPAAANQTATDPPATTAAATPEPAPPLPELPPGLIVVPWMPQHPRYGRVRRPSWEKPPTVRACQHRQSEWFCHSFDPDSLESKYYFRSARDVDVDDWSNPLSAMCQGATDSFDLPADELYALLVEKPDVHIAHHNPASGQFGCSNCSSMTEAYDCQNYLNPQCARGRTGKALKSVEEVRTAYREFIGMVLGWDELIRVQCRHRHGGDAPPPPPQPPPQPALQAIQDQHLVTV